LTGLATCSSKRQRCESLFAGETGIFVAKVVKTFGCVAYTTETLDEFRYEKLHSVAETGRRGENRSGFDSYLPSTWSCAFDTARKNNCSLPIFASLPAAPALPEIEHISLQK
jgi:hypothetical protein